MAVSPTLQIYSNADYWLIILLFIAIATAIFAVVRLYVRQASIQRRELEKRVQKRTGEISRQKEELQKQSEELQEAYLQIKTKNMAIEEAFEHLTNSYARLSDVNREKDGIISIVAHDLRTPLNNIDGLVHLIAMGENLTQDQEEYIAKIRTVVKHGNELIRDLLDVNQTKNRNPQLNIDTINLPEFVNDWKASFEKTLLSKKQTLKLSGEYQSIQLKTDSSRLSRILDNLMSNAIKFSEVGRTIKIEINQINDAVRIILEDEGPGISEEDQKNMFKPFTRLSAQPTNGEPSNGLGLSIIKNLTEQLGGQVEVSSKLGFGTKFIITLPLETQNKKIKKRAAV